MKDEKLTSAAILYLSASKELAPHEYSLRHQNFEAELGEYLATHDLATPLVLQFEREGMTFVFPVGAVKPDRVRPESTTDITQQDSSREGAGENSARPNFYDEQAQVTLALQKTVWDTKLNFCTELPAIVWFNIVETLYGINPEGDRIPVLATDAKSDSSHRIWKIRLRDNIRFSDGSDLTAADICKSWQRNLLLVKQSRCSWDWLWMDIAGAEDFIAGKEKNITGLQAVGGNTLKITLKESRPNFVEHLTQPCFGVIKTPDPHKNRELAGTGPFRLKQVLDGKNTSTFLCVRNEYYHGGESLLKEVRFQFRKDNVIDALMQGKRYGTIVKQKKDIEYFQKLDSFRTTTFPVQPVYFLAMNPLIKPLSDLSLRQYIATSVLRRWEIANIVTEAEVIEASTFFTPENIEVTAPQRGTLPSVRQALNIAFRGQDGVARQIAERLHARFDQAGILCSPPKALSARDFDYLRQSGKYDILVDSFTPTFTMPHYNLLQLLRTGYSVNSGAIEELEATLKKKELQTAYLIEKRLIEQAVFHPLIRTMNYTALPAELKDANLVSAHYLDFSKAWIPKTIHANKN